MTRKPVVTRFHLFAFGVLIAITATAFVKIHAETGLPVHWGLDGKPDQVWPRNTALLVMPAIAVALGALFGAIGFLVPAEQVEPGRRVIETMLTGFLGLLCALQFALILIGVGSDIDLVRIVAFAVAALLLGLGAMLPNSPPTGYSGIRLPWTMRNRANWVAAHRLTGALMIVAGAALGLVAWLWPNPTDMFAALAAAILLPLILGGLFSFIRSRLPPGPTSTSMDRSR
jgi:uncharacterized membrane protein